MGNQVAGSRRVAVLLLALVLLFASTARAQSAAGLVREAYDLAYNLDHDEAEARLERALALAPNDSATHRAAASITWLNILFRRGAITVDHYMGSMSKPRVATALPPAALANGFHRHVDRAIQLSRAWTDRSPRSAQAWYELGAALGLEASYTASVEGKLMAGFRAAKGAYDAHERVLDLDPKRLDAALIVGTYRYLVASLSLPMRWMAYIAGFGGGRARGIRMIEQAAGYGGDNRTEARFALLLIYNRERRYDEALAVIRELRAHFPRNRLLELEYGATALRAGRAAEAETVLTRGIDHLLTDRRPRAGGEVPMWHYKRGAARVRLGKLDSAAQDLKAARADDAPRWIRGRATAELGKIADLRGDRQSARASYKQAAALCEADRDPICANEAQALEKKGYRR
jgi:tetratricopeptide (TPR) repeat protein